MKLIKESVTNFRGIQSLEINADGRNVNIYGPNGAGKTTTEDAFLWLLFGKDSADKKDFDLIPHKSGLTEPDIGQGKEPTVQATLEYFGKIVTLKKTYIEEWPKKGEFRGQYTGSKTHYYVDDLEVKAGEYQSIISELVDDRLFKLITNPQFFINLPWQEKRETLVKIVGELNVIPVPELEKLMNGRKFEEFHALGKQKVKEKLKEIEGIPFAISAVKKLIPADLPELPDISALTAKKSELDEQLQNLKNDDSANIKRREIAQIETEIFEARNTYNAEIDASNVKIKALLNEVDTEHREKANNLHDIAAKIVRLAYDIDCSIEIKSNKLNEYHDVEKRVWTGSDLCPLCGQPMPVEEIEATKAIFNKQHSDDLERLVSQGKALKAEIEGKEIELNELRASVEILGEEVEVLTGRIEKGRAMVKAYEFESTDEFKVLNFKIGAIKRDLEIGTDDSKNNKITAIQSEISTVQQQINDANRIKIQIEQKIEQEKRVTELMTQEKILNTELGKFEKVVDLCEKHVKAKAKALEQAVNGKFKIARFRLFSMQKNGEEAECCDVIYPNGSVNLSTGERLQTGIDIINTLTEFYGVDAPVWVDNAEGITLLIDSKAQLINLVVSKEYKNLKVEVL